MSEGRGAAGCNPGRPRPSLNNMLGLGEPTHTTHMLTCYLVCIVCPESTYARNATRSCDTR
eukprot:1665924-Pyramimonas_sp.AAC.1